jgi:hypothetical protein
MVLGNKANTGYKKTQGTREIKQEQQTWGQKALEGVNKFFQFLDDAGNALMIHDPIPSGTLPPPLTPLTVADNGTGLAMMLVGKGGKIITNTIPEIDDVVDSKKIQNLIKDMKDWLGDGAKLIKNKSGDTVIISEKGTKRVRFDINNPSPHNNPHGHVEELVNGKWDKSGPLYPKDVPHN